jgi:hypothetical protein
MSASDLNDAISRIVAIGALGGVALVHVLQLPVAFDATGYLGALFIVVVLACLALAALLARSNDRRVWEAAAALPALVLLGYIISRTVGLPGFTDDIGVWSQRLGLASMVVVGLLIWLSVAVLEPAPSRSRAAGTGMQSVHPA